MDGLAYHHRFPFQDSISPPPSNRNKENNPYPQIENPILKILLLPKNTITNGRIDLKRRQTRSRTQNPIQLPRKTKIIYQGSVQICPFLKSFSPPEPSPPDRVGEKRRSKQRERGSRRNRNSIELRKKVC